MGGSYAEGPYFVYLVVSLVPAILLGVLAILTRWAVLAKKPVDALVKYKTAANYASLAYMIILGIGVLAYIILCGPRKEHQLEWEFLSSVKKWGHFHIYYYITLQYTPSIFVAHYFRKHTLKQLTPSEDTQEEATVVNHPIL